MRQSISASGGSITLPVPVILCHLGVTRYMKVILSRRVFFEGEFQPAGICVEKGRITAVVSPDRIPAEAELHDHGKHVIMPGLIDAHVHINEPGRTDWEGFETATRAAAAGGITTLVDMPLNSAPVTTTQQALKQKRASAQGKLAVDCGFYGGLIPGNEQEIEGLLDDGVLGIKIFLCDSGLPEFPAATEKELRTAMPVLARRGKPLLAHAELTDENQPDWAPSSYTGFSRSRPESWEVQAVDLLIRLCRETGCRVHIVHVASVLAAERITLAKKEGLPLSCETAPHYLYFATEDIPDGDTRYKCAPPIRDRKNREGLWRALNMGTIDFVATDHSPCLPELKHLESGDLKQAWGGISSLQLLLPVLWTAGQKHGANLTDIARWTSEAPAHMLGLQLNKGNIKAGYEASLVVWDPETSFTVDAKKLYHKHAVTPYDRALLSGRVMATYLRGTKIYNGQNLLNINEGQLD